MFASLIFRVSLCGKFANFFRGLQRIDQDRGDCRFLYPVCFLGVKFLAASVERGRLLARARAGYANAITNSRSLCGERKKEERFAEKMELGIFIPPLIRYSRRTAAAEGGGEGNQNRPLSLNFLPVKMLRIALKGEIVTNDAPPFGPCHESSYTRLVHNSVLGCMTPCPGFLWPRGLVHTI